MKFFFGTYAIKLKTFNEEDLNLDEKKYSNYTFLVYVKVFHILLIPFFPLEKFWVIKDEYSNDFVNTDASLRHQLTLKQLKIKNPFWSFSGCIIFCIPILFWLFNILGGLFTVNKPQTDYEFYVAKKERIINKIHHPSLNHMYSIEVHRSGYKDFLEYDVISFTQDTIVLKLEEKVLRVSPKLNYSDTISISKMELFNTLNTDNLIMDCFFPIKHLCQDSISNNFKPFYTIESIY
ncbi:hypothetical protein [uncultured Psychroserpens sp.]|uniref:hypothetical protein n=1 Tax=uncultured Psychroserpens sp. TaxID=255436 RepID=UPI0026331812|nr:hypothetical protein [uncultured Psychroserpens sp.]